MSTKTYCDCCGREMTGQDIGRPDHTSLMLLSRGNHFPEVREGRDMAIKVSLHGLKQNVDVCRYCILDEVAKLDDRPRAGPA